MSLKYHYNTIKINHIELIVKNLNESKKFYTESLGFQVLAENSNYVSFTVDNQTEMIRIIKGKTKSNSSQTVGLYHFALLLPSRKDLSLFLHHLISKQIPISGASDHLVSESIYLRDLDGNGIEIAYDREDTHWFDEFRELQMDTIEFDYSGVYYENDSFETFNKLPKETVIGHLHLSVGNLQKQTKFYHELIGFDISFDKIHKAVFLASNSYHHHLALNAWNHASENQTGQGLYSFTISFPDCDSLKSVIDRFEQNHIPLQESNMGYMTKDFDNNLVYLKLDM